MEMGKVENADSKLERLVKLIGGDNLHWVWRKLDVIYTLV